MIRYLSTIGPENFTLAMLGILIHVVTSVWMRSSKEKEQFSIVFYFKDSRNYLRIILSILSTIAILLVQPEISKFTGIGKDESASRFFALFAGLLNHYLIKKILARFKTKIK